MHALFTNMARSPPCIIAMKRLAKDRLLIEGSAVIAKLGLATIARSPAGAPGRGAAGAALGIPAHSAVAGSAVVQPRHGREARSEVAGVAEEEKMHNNQASNNNKQEYSMHAVLADGP